MLTTAIETTSDNFAAQLGELFGTFKLKQHVKESKHTLGTKLDLFLCDDDINICDLTIMDVAVWGHYLLTHSIDLSAAPSTFVTRTAHNWKNLNIKVFHDGVVAVLGIDKSESWADDLLDNLVNMYDRTMTSLLYKLAPSRTKTLCLTIKCLVWQRMPCCSNLAADECLTAATGSHGLTNGYHQLRDSQRS